MAEAVAYQVFETTRDSTTVSIFCEIDGDVMELTATISQPEQFDDITVVARLQNAEISFPKAAVLTAALSLAAACITVKVTLTLIRAIGRCLAQGHRTPTALVECLQARGVDLGEELFGAVLECLALRFVGGA